MLLRKQINPPCPKCGGKVYAGVRWINEECEVSTWYCHHCDWTEDQGDSDYKATYEDYRTPESEVAILRTHIEELEHDLNNLRQIAEYTRTLKAERDQLTVTVKELEAQNRHDDEADTACRNLLMEENDALRDLSEAKDVQNGRLIVERDRYKEALERIVVTNNNCAMAYETMRLNTLKYAIEAIKGSAPTSVHGS